MYLYSNSKNHQNHTWWTSLQKLVLITCIYFINAILSCRYTVIVLSTSRTYNYSGSLSLLGTIRGHFPATTSSNDFEKSLWFHYVVQFSGFWNRYDYGNCHHNVVVDIKWIHTITNLKHNSIRRFINNCNTMIKWAVWNPSHDYRCRFPLWKWSYCWWSL